MPNTPNSARDFWDRFVDLQEEATKYGVASIVVLYDPDPISREATALTSRACCPYVALGLLQNAKRGILDDLRKRE